MHAYGLIRGIKHEVDRFITELQGKYVPYEVKEGAAGIPKGTYYAQIHVRPIQLYEFVFPREQKDIVLTTIFGMENGATQHKKHKKWIYALRKMLGVEPFPVYDNKLTLPISRQHMEVIGVGVKDDYDFADGTEAL